MGTAVLAFPVVRGDGVISGMLVSGLNNPHHIGIVPPLSPLVYMLVEIDEEIYLVYLVILSVVALGSWSCC